MADIDIANVRDTYLGNWSTFGGGELIPSEKFIQIKKLAHGKDLPTPEYKSKEAAGFDLYAAVTEATLIHPGCRAAIPTGLAVAIPVEYELQVRPRSGLSLKNGITIVNSPGTVDSDYRGEIVVILLNTDLNVPFFVNRGDRIAQAVVAPVVQVHFVEVDELPSTERGEKGFGSTGI